MDSNPEKVCYFLIILSFLSLRTAVDHSGQLIVKLSKRFSKLKYSIFEFTGSPDQQQLHLLPLPKRNPQAQKEICLILT